MDDAFQQEDHAARGSFGFGSTGGFNSDAFQPEDEAEVREIACSYNRDIPGAYLVPPDDEAYHTRTPPNGVQGVPYTFPGNQMVRTPPNGGEGVPHAVPVDQMVVEARPLDEGRRKLGPLSLILLFATAIVILAISLGVTLSKSSNVAPTTTATSAPQNPFTTASISPAPVPSLVPPNMTQVVSYFKSSLPNETLDVLLPFSENPDDYKNESSPQSRAYAWATSNKQLPSLFADLNPVDRMTRRFALATVFFATGGETNWGETTGWLNESLDECDWLGCSCNNTVADSTAVFQSLDLSRNRLIGSVPPEVGLLSTLKSLNLIGNGLTGSIPTQLGRLTNLQRLALSSNAMAGNLPTELALLNHSLVGLFMAGNNDLTGPLPQTFTQVLGRLTHLQELSISQNSLSGTIPTTIGLLTQLRYFDLAEQELQTQPLLHGSIPTELFLLTNLRMVDMHGNAITGTIAPELGLRLTNLKQLYLDRNALTGTIPSTLAGLSKLRSLDLFRNDLSGSVPTELCQVISSYGELELRIECFEVACACDCYCFENRSEWYKR